MYSQKWDSNFTWIYHLEVGTLYFGNRIAIATKGMAVCKTALVGYFMELSQSLSTDTLSSSKTKDQVHQQMCQWEESDHL